MPFTSVVSAVRVLTRVALVSLALAGGLCVRARAEDPPRRVVSFNLCADELLIALADPAQIVGVSPYATDPSLSTVAEEARAFRRLGFQAEETIPLQPDVILVGAWDRSVSRRLLSRLGFRMHVVDTVNNFASGIAEIREVARVLGHPERGEKLLAEIEAARQRLAAASRPRNSTALMVSNGGYTAGPENLASELMREAGLLPPPGAPGGYGSVVPLEKLITLRPDYLVLLHVITEPDSQSAAYLTHPALRGRYPSSRQIILPERYTTCGGPSLVAALDYLTNVVTRLAELERRAAPQ